MATSLYKIAEQAKVILGDRVGVQVLIESAKNAYGILSKKAWYENVSFDEQTIDGSILTTFKDIDPILDLHRDMYYIVLPSAYLNLPHQAGIVWVSNMKDRTSWVNIKNWGIYSQIKASLMGGRQVYEVEGTRVYFPKMTKEDIGCPILLKLAIAYDELDPYEPLNIGPDMVNEIVKLVVELYAAKQDPTEKVREVIN